MAVLRVKKTRNFSIVSNYYLNDQNLSLKAVGLLTKMLSFPENWNYTIRGLAAICKDGVGAISSGIQELERAGYVVRRQLRGENGRIVDTEYTIYEWPMEQEAPPPSTPKAPDGPLASPASSTTAASAPAPGHPASVPPRGRRGKGKGGDVSAPGTAGGPERASGGVVSKSGTIAGEEQKEPGPVAAQGILPYPKNSDTVKCAELNTNVPKTNQSISRRRKGPRPGEITAADVLAERERIRAQIEYGGFDPRRDDMELVDEIVELILDESMGTGKYVKFGRGKRRPRELVRARFALINHVHVERMLDAIYENTARIRNPRGYLREMLYNAPASTGTYYAMQTCAG